MPSTIIPRRPGLGVLRKALDRPTFTLTDSELERRFLPDRPARGPSLDRRPVSA